MNRLKKQKNLEFKCLLNVIVIEGDLVDFARSWKTLISTILNMQLELETGNKGDAFEKNLLDYFVFLCNYLFNKFLINLDLFQIFAHPNGSFESPKT